jgi:hypothetical protein
MGGWTAGDGLIAWLVDIGTEVLGEEHPAIKVSTAVAISSPVFISTPLFSKLLVFSIGGKEMTAQWCKYGSFLSRDDDYQ